MYTFQEEMFIGLLLRAMKNDVNLKRVSAFSKRLLQVSGDTCSCLVLFFMWTFFLQVYNLNLQI